MTNEERKITISMLDLIERIKNKTDNINTNDRIPELELEVILSKIEQLHQKAIVLKYLRKQEDIDSPIYSQKEKEKIENNEIINTVEQVEVVTPEKIVEIKNIQKDISAFGLQGAKLTVDDIGEKLQKQPISDIRQAIGINDKFSFINELFKGNTNEYETIIDLLNQYSSIEEAMNTLEKYNWSNDNEITQSFLNIITRKYL